jgi:hypothetical protein
MQEVFVTGNVRHQTVVTGLKLFCKFFQTNIKEQLLMSPKLYGTGKCGVSGRKQGGEGQPTPNAV